MGQLREKVCGWMDAQEAKHEYPQPNFAEFLVDAMSNYELLCVIDEAIEELLNDRDSVRHRV